MGPNNEAAAAYFHYVRERQLIHERRSAGLPAPWTTDRILQVHHFCNNRREDDRVTKELRKAVQAYTLHTAPHYSLPATYALARLFNLPSTVRLALSAINCGHHWPRVVKQHREAGYKTFHTAYVVSTCGKVIDKVDYVAGVVENVQKLDVPTASLAEAFDSLRSVDGLGSFLAGQLVADLKNDRYLAEAHDWWTWSSMGPGSKKGLDILFGKGTSERNYEERMEMLRAALPEDIAAMKFHAQDLQNTLCEFSKYWGYITEAGGRRRLFNARLDG